MSRLTAPALRRGLDILELFLASNEGLRVPEIAEKLSLPRASVHELVGALTERGYLQADPDSPRHFRLGVRTFQLGGAYERELDLATLGRASANRIAIESGETVQVAIRDERDVVYLAKADSTRSVRLVSTLGGRLPAHCTAVGKVLLAALSSEEIDSLFPDDTSLAPMIAHSISTRHKLNENLQLVRQLGWAEENSESNAEVACVAAPIYDQSGTCVAAMSISVPILRWSEAKKATVTALARKGADDLSANLGWVDTSTDALTHY